MMNVDISKLEEEDLSGLATDWYFLDLQARQTDQLICDDAVNALIVAGLKLKAELLAGNYLESTPLSVYVDEDTYFDVWINSAFEICAGELYCEAAENFN